MNTTLSRLVFAFAAVVAVTAVAPMTASFADSMTSPNAVNNAMIDEGMTHASSTGVYDGGDQYRNAEGFPQPGWQYLSLPPS
jgi:hypothetical protein